MKRLVLFIILGVLVVGIGAGLGYRKSQQQNDVKTDSEAESSDVAETEEQSTAFEFESPEVVMPPGEGEKRISSETQFPVTPTPILGGGSAPVDPNEKTAAIGTVQKKTIGLFSGNLFNHWRSLFARLVRAQTLTHTRIIAYVGGVTPPFVGGFFEQGQIFTYDLSSGKHEQLTLQDYSFSLAIGEKTNKIAFITDTTNMVKDPFGTNMKLELMDLLSKQVTLVDTGGLKPFPHPLLFSHDGTKLLYARYRFSTPPGFSPDIRFPNLDAWILYDVVSKTKTTLTSSVLISDVGLGGFFFSADDSKIYVVDNSMKVLSEYNIATSQSREIFRIPSGSNDLIAIATLSDSGEEIYYTRLKIGLVPGDFGPTLGTIGSEFVRINIVNGQELYSSPLPTVKGPDLSFGTAIDNYLVSAERNKVYYTRIVGLNSLDRELFELDLISGNAKRLTPTPVSTILGYGLLNNSIIVLRRTPESLVMKIYDYNLDSGVMNKLFEVTISIAPVPLKIKVLTPSNGETLKVGSSYNIKWETNVSYSEDTTINLLLLRESPLGVSVTIASDIPINSLSYSWNVSSYTTSNEQDGWRIFLDVSGGGGYKSEGTFSIVP